jgi:putative acetyltransferase
VRIRKINEQAFEGSSEAKAVDMLREANKAIVSLVASYNGQLAGHILFSPLLMDSAPAGFKGIGLAPVAVLPEFQNKGIGSKLIKEGLKICQELGCDIVVVLGHTNYYPRFGFLRASDYGIKNEYGVDDPFMVMELRAGALSEISGMIKYQPEFEEAEG